MSHRDAILALEAYEESSGFEGTTPELAEATIRAILFYIEDIADEEIAQWVYESAGEAR